MRIAIHSGLTMWSTVGKVVAEVARAAEAGFAGYWAPMLTGHDTLTAFAIAGREVPAIELGTAVVPMPLRPPYALAQQVATVQDACEGRFVLGLGPSHEPLVRETFGLDWQPPLAETRRYVAELTAVMAGTDGRALTVASRPTPVLLGAMNPRMAALAAEIAAGVITWAAGPATLRDVIGPALRGSAATRLVAGLPVCVTDDEDAARANVHRLLGVNDRLPSYRRLLAREGVDGVAHMAVVGTADEVGGRLDELAASGATDFAAHVMAPTRADAGRTWEFLADRATAAVATSPLS